MNEQIDAYPVGALVEEVTFSLAGLASRDGPTIDTRDWYGSRLPDFSAAREFGFPFLDLAIRPPGALNVIVQYAVPTLPLAEPPVLAFTDAMTLAVVGASWGRFEGQRLTAHFARVRVTDTSGVANNNIHLVHFIRGN